MTATTILHKGKYSGSSFEDILLKDLAYCSFISDMKFCTKELQEFKDWLIVTLPIAKENFRMKEITRINKVLTS